MDWSSRMRLRSQFVVAGNLNLPSSSIEVSRSECSSPISLHSSGSLMRVCFFRGRLGDPAGRFAY
jgi:hypothetical protein